MFERNEGNRKGKMKFSSIAETPNKMIETEQTRRWEAYGAPAIESTFLFLMGSDMSACSGKGKIENFLCKNETECCGRRLLV